MEEPKKGRGGLIATIVILILLLIGACTYIVYDKFVADHSNPTKEVEEENKDDVITKTNANDLQNAINNEIDMSKYAEKRNCTGTYKGEGKVATNAQSGEDIKGTIEFVLKEDNTYYYTKDGGHGAAGDYMIIDNILILKQHPESPGSKYDFYPDAATISSDCSKITTSIGYITGTGELTELIKQ